MAPRREKQPSAGSWPLCSETTAMCLSFLPTTADVLNCDRVCRSFRACKAALPSEVLLTGNVSRTAWLQNNVARVSKLQLVVSGSHVTNNSNLITVQEYAKEVCSALVGARLHKLDIINVPLFYVSTGNRSLSLPDGVFQLTTLQHLGLSNMSKHALPSQLALLTGLTSLSIDKCDKLVSLPEALGQLSRLQGIIISDSDHLASLPSSIGALSNLQCLSISKRFRLASLPEAIGQLASLQLLSVDSVSHMPSLPESVSRLTQLRTLKATGRASYLTGHGAPAIPISAIGKMTSLTRLEMTWRTDSLPDDIGDLSKLEVLVATCATLTALPSTVGFLSSLRVLRLCDCKMLQQLPEALGELSSLQELELEGSTVYKLPESLGNLTGLRRLHISGSTMFDSFPASISSLVSLQHLWISGSRMHHLDLAHLISLQHLIIKNCCSLGRIQGMEQLVSLEELNIRECRALRPLPSGCWEQLACLQEIDMYDVGSLVASLHSNCLSNLTGLQRIRIASAAGLTQLPSSLESLTSLQRLHLSVAGLTVLPTGLGKLSSLTHITLSECRKLSELPASWGNLQSLQCCTIESCKTLLALPASTSRLTALTSLSIYGLRKLAALPASFGSLGKLQTLSIIGCPVLASLPNRLQRLTSLKDLTILSCDALESLPSGLGKLSLLQYLHIHSCPSLTSIEGTWEEAAGLYKVSIKTCLKLGTLPERLRQMSGHLFSAAYKGPTGRMYPTNLALAAGDLQLGSPEYAAAEEEQQDDDVDEDNPFLVHAVLDEVEVGVTRKRSHEVVQVVKVLVKWKGFELDVGAWEPLSGVQHTTAWKKWAKMKRKPTWFRAVKPEAAAEAFKAMKLD